MKDLRMDEDLGLRVDAQPIQLHPGIILPLRWTCLAALALKTVMCTYFTAPSANRSQYRGPSLCCASQWTGAQIISLEQGFSDRRMTLGMDAGTVRSNVWQIRVAISFLDIQQGVVHGSGEIIVAKAKRHPSLLSTLRNTLVSPWKISKRM